MKSRGASTTSLLGSKSINKLVSDDISFKNFQLNPIIKTAMIREAFKLFDSDNSGEIDPYEFEKLVKSLGIELDKQRIKELYKEIDKNRSNTIDLEEFTEMMIKFQFSNDSSIKLHLENTFNNYDYNCDGYIDKEDLMKVSKELGESVNIDEMEALISVMKQFAIDDKVGENAEPDKLSKEEFEHALNRLQFIEEVNKDGNELTGLTNGGNGGGNANPHVLNPHGTVTRSSHGDLASNRSLKSRISIRSDRSNGSRNSGRSRSRGSSS
jgi:Ca2+-binding EF-hand superfamily protein